MIKAKPLERGKRGRASASPRGSAAAKPAASGMNSHDITKLAERLTKLADDYRADVASVIDDAKAAEVDAGALRRLVGWMRKDELARLEQEAVDDQYRFLAGLRAGPAELPAEGELATAAALFADNMTIRAVAKEMGLSVGKAHQLKIKAAAFGVHVHAEMNTPPAVARAVLRDTVAAMEAAALPAHNPITGEIPPANGAAGEECLSGRDAPSDEHSTSCGGGENRRPAEAGNMPGSVPGEETVSAPSRLVGLDEEGPSKARAGVATGPQDLTAEPTRAKNAPVEDDLTIPPHLKRERVAA